MNGLYTQMVGRGLRLHSDKDKLTLIDCVGVTGKASLCTAPSLLGIDASDVPPNRQDALDETTKNMFIIYDDFVKIRLSSLEELKTDLTIDAETGKSIDISSSINSDVYNQIKLVVRTSYIQSAVLKCSSKTVPL